MSLKIYYFASSHWDREWYQTFQQFRYYLVDTGKELLECLENDPDFKIFNFDGQSIVIEDILEIRPEYRARFSGMIESGRMNIGPWYVQPDEFLVSGEALIHNLLIGHETAREFNGTPWKVGYLCDIFGHIAQMPQILRGFGIDNAVVWRGLPENTGSYFIWRAPDGSEITTVKLPEFQGYGDFAGQVAGFWNKPLPEAEFKENARRYIDNIIRENGNAPVLLMDGVDHAPVHAAVPQYIEWLRELYPDSEVCFSDLLDLLKVVKTSISGMKTISGELAYTTRRPDGFMHLITHTLSSYYPLKQANDECRNVLELLTSPLVAAAGQDYEYLKKAWKYLIQNQAHDSICGCSIDQVHKDMEYRFDQVKEIADAVANEFICRDRNRYTESDLRDECYHISSGVTRVVPNGENGELAIRFFNPLPYPCEEVINFEIVFPVEYDSTFAEPFGYETINAFFLKNEAGEVLPYRITSIKRNHTKRLYRYDSRQYNCYNVTAKVSLKPFGWTMLTAVPAGKPVRYLDTQLTGPMTAETTIIRLQIERDGTFILTDKRNDRIYGPMNVFVTDAEIGDGWNHVCPVGAAASYSTGKNAGVKLLEDGPVRTVFEITQEVELPQEVNYSGNLNENYSGIRQSEKSAILKLATRIILDADSPLIKLRTEIDNNIKDYRLRMLMPTGIPGAYVAHQAFCCLERRPGRSTDTSDWKEPEQIEKNFSDIVGKRDSRGGIMFFSRAGLHEVGAVDNVSGDMYITFLRAFRRTVATNGEGRCQLPGQIAWDYGFYLADAEDCEGKIHRAGQIYRAPRLNYTAHRNTEYSLPDESLLSLDSDAVCMSIIKPAETGKSNEMIIRLFNLEDTTQKAKLNFSISPGKCEIINMEEQKIDEIAINSPGITLDIRPKQIMSLKLTR